MPGVEIERVIGVVKAYSSCVGEGPFVCELFGDEADRLREIGGEFDGHKPHRVGPIDLVATRYGVEMQGATCLAITKLDVLSYMDRIPVCTHYRIGNELTDGFPFPALLYTAEAVIEYVEGWKCDISLARKWDDLPPAAQKYIEMIEQSTGCPVKYISVGAERDRVVIR
jgi:adenylosuccinate synthase